MFLAITGYLILEPERLLKADSGLRQAGSIGRNQRRIQSVASTHQLPHMRKECC